MNATRARLVVVCGFVAQGVLAAQPARPVDAGVVLVDASGRQIAAPSESDPRPVVHLDPVRRQDVRMRAPLTAEVTISGTVTDDLADIVPGHEADIKEVEVGHQQMRVVPVPVAPTATRPFAFRGRFSGVVSLDVGGDNNIIAVEARNAVRRLGSSGVNLRFKTDIHWPTDVTTGSLHVLKGLGPFTMQIAPLRRDAQDTVVFFLGARVQPGEETRLVETGADTRTFIGHSAQLGDVTLRLEDRFDANDPSQDETLHIRLSSTFEIVIDEELALQETAPSSGTFRSRAGRLPNDAMIRVDYHPLDDTVVDVLRVQPGSYKAFFGLEPMGAAVLLRETSAASRLFEGQVPGLGATRMLVEGVADGSLHLTIDSTEAGVTGYRMWLDRDSKGYYIDADMPREHYTIPPTAPDSATLLDIEPWEGPDASRFYPFWAIATGLRQVTSGDYAEIDGRHLELTTEPLPWRPAATPVRSKLPLVLVSRRSSIPGDVVQLRAPNVIAAGDGRAHEIRFVVGNR